MNEKLYYIEKVDIDDGHYADVSFIIDYSYNTADIYLYSRGDTDSYYSVYIVIDEELTVSILGDISEEAHNLVDAVINAMLSIINKEEVLSN